MYTQCPECNQKKMIDACELRQSRGVIKCPTCSVMFDALERLQSGTIDESVLPDFQPLAFVKANQSILWGIGLGLNIILLIVQVYWFESERFVQNEQLRPTLVVACDYLNCQLPDYRNLEQITILYSNFEQLDKHYQLRLTLVNQSPFKQPYPDIQLSLTNLAGRGFAERVFSPSHYLINPSKKLTPDRAIDISLNIARPQQDIGGYQVKLMPVADY